MVQAVDQRTRVSEPVSVHPSDGPAYSIVIPTFNGSAVLAETCRRVISFFQARALTYELIVVNDGSTDRTWELLQRLAEQPNVVAIDLAGNYGQHSATMCGLRASTGNYAITIDDDLQHDPNAFDPMMAKAAQGHDVVFARFRQSRHPWYRRPEAVVVAMINRAAFGLPPDMMVSSFRLLRRDVIDRMLAREPVRPYVTALALMSCSSPANALVEHYKSARGRSTYSLQRQLKLVSTVIFGFAGLPLRLMTGIGAIAVALGFSLAAALGLGMHSAAVWAFGLAALLIGGGTLVFWLGFFGQRVKRLSTETPGLRSYQVTKVIGSRSIKAAHPASLVQRLAR